MRSRGTWRLRCAAVAAVGLLVGAATATVDAHAAGAPFVPGSGYASGHAMDLTDVYGGARLGFDLADATAQYQDGTAQASGAPIDSGLASLSAELQTCGQYAYPAVLVPPTTSVSTNDNGNTRPVSATNAGTSTAPAGAVTVQARPNAAGRTVITGGTAAMPGLVAVTGATVQTLTSTEPATDARQAEADIRVGDVSLLGGLVRVRGLHWNATLDVTGPDSRSDHRAVTPTFEVGSVTVAGITIPFPSGGSDAAALAQVDHLAAPLGVQLRLPSVQRSTSGGSTNLTITPLTVAFGGKTAFGPAVGALLGGATLPQIENDLKPGVFDPTTCTELGGLLEGSKPVNADWNLIGSEYPLILGATLAAINGGGEVDVDLGGVTTTLDDTAYPAADFGGPAFSTSGGTSSMSTPASPALPGPSSFSAVPPPARQTPIPSGVTETITTRTIACRSTSPVGHPMCWGGHALAAGVGAAVLTGGLMAADESFRRRRARRRPAEARS